MFYTFNHERMIRMFRLALRTKESFILVANIFDSLIVNIAKILMLILFGTFRHL
jgi:hypothetical protein